MARDEPFVFDATPLIYLAKAGALEHLARLPNPFLVPPRVIREVVEEGKRRGAPEALTVERLVATGRFQVQRVRSQAVLARLREDPRLSEADRESLALAAERHARLVADEEALRSTARVLGIKTGGSLFLLRLLVDGGILSRPQAVETVDRMIAQGWFCSPALYRSFASSLG